MMQENLFAPSKRNDPDTSREAGALFDASGKRSDHFQQILVTLSDVFPFTAAEIAKWSPLDRFQVSRRLKEMEGRGLVKRCEKKPCSILKSNCGTWMITSAGKDAIK